MRSIRNLALLVAVVALAVASSSARADENAKGKKHHGHGVHGVVTAVDAKANTITVQVTPHHKKGADAAATPPAEKPEEKTFTVNADTKYFFVSGKKGEDKKEATLADVAQGEHVVVLKKGEAATEVLIRQKKEKKPAA